MKTILTTLMELSPTELHECGGGVMPAGLLEVMDCSDIMPGNSVSTSLPDGTCLLKAEDCLINGAPK
jgi:hypothetical protein